MFLFILKGSQKSLIRNWPFGKLLPIFVSENITRSKLLARSFARNSNLFLIELMLRCEKISLFKLLLRSNFKWLVSGQKFLLLDLYPAKLLLPVISPSVLHKTHCHWNVYFIFLAQMLLIICWVLSWFGAILIRLNVGVLCFCYDQLNWCFYLYTFLSGGYSLFELYVDVYLFW